MDGVKGGGLDLAVGEEPPCEEIMVQTIQRLPSTLQRPEQFSHRIVEKQPRWKIIKIIITVHRD